MKYWYYAVEGDVSGPVGIPQLIELIEQQSLSPKTPIWAQGMPGWMPADVAAEELGWNLGATGGE